MASQGSTESTLVDVDRVQELERRLRELYGQPRHFNPEDPLDDLIFLVLSRIRDDPCLV